MSAVKHDRGKADYTYLHGLEDALEACLFLLEWGHETKGYPKDNWRGIDPDRYKSALYRHLAEMGRHASRTGMASGSAIDEESGFLHATHVAVNALFMLANVLRAGEEGCEYEP